MLYVVVLMPDMQYSIMICSRAVGSPAASDAAALKRSTRYVSRTRHKWLHLEPTLGNLRVSAWADADWAGDASRRSCTGGLLCINGAVVLSWSRMQAAYALSSCEAELY